MKKSYYFTDVNEFAKWKHSTITTQLSYSRWFNAHTIDELSEMMRLQNEKRRNKQSNSGTSGGKINIELHKEELLKSSAEWRAANPDMVLKHCTDNGYLTMSKHPNLAKENGKKTGDWAVESGHLDNVRDINKMLAGANKVIKCPHCEKEAQLANMKRWHFDNCKFKTK